MLAKALRWAALSCANLEHFTSPDRVGLELTGIAEACLTMSRASDLMSTDHHEVYASLGDRLRDLAARLNAGGHEGYNELDSLTITRTPAEAEVAS